MVSIVGGTLGMAELHCACVAKNQKGLLLAGPSGSGKSTLSLALTQAGFEFLSDDRTLCSLRAGKLSAWGMPVSPKLRHEAAVWFPQLRGQEPRELQKGERVFRRNLEATLCFKRAPACAPRCIVFLEPMPGSGFQLAPMPRKEAATRLAKGLMAELPEAVQAQIAIIDSLVELTCWRLQYDAPPQDIVDRLGHLLEM
jgi:hypothetical protein